MYTGSLPSTSVHNTWSENIEVRSVDDGELADLSILTEITLRMRSLVSRFDELKLTKSNGDITIPSPGIIQWRAEATAMGTLEPKMYEVILLLEDTTDTIALVLGTISIVE